MAATPDLQELETRRDDLRQQLASIGDLRPGSLVARYRKCGKPYPKFTQLTGYFADFGRISRFTCL